MTRATTSDRLSPQVRTLAGALGTRGSSSRGQGFGGRAERTVMTLGTAPSPSVLTAAGVHQSPRRSPLGSDRVVTQAFSGSNLANLLVSFGTTRATTAPKEPKMSKNSKGTLYVRITPEVHRRARVRALSEGVNLAEIVEAALVLYLAAETSPDVPTDAVKP